MILAEVQAEVWVAIITALGIAVTSTLLSLMTAAFQMFMTYKASNKVEAVRVDLEKSNRAKVEADEANAAKLDEIAKTGKDTYEASNHNYQKMQEEASQARIALEKANKEIANGSKEIAEMAKALALMTQAKIQPQSPSQPSSEDKPLEASHGPGDEIKVAKLELELASKPTVGDEGEKEIKVEKLELELASKPKPTEEPKP